MVGVDCGEWIVGIQVCNREEEVCDGEQVNQGD